MLSNRSRREQLAYLVLGAAVLVGMGFVGMSRMRHKEPIQITPITAPPTEGTPTAPAPGPLNGTIVVDIGGAVVTPGVYRLPEGARLNDAIKDAGGTTKDADLTQVNRATKLNDSDMIRIPKKGQQLVASPAPTGGHGSQRRVEAPPPLAGAISNSQPTGVITSVTPIQPAKPNATTDAAGPKDSGEVVKKSRSKKGKAPAEPVDINTATEAELETLPGVGPATASNILDYRKENGPFKSVDDLQSVSGIGEKKLAKMRPYVKL